MLNIHITYYHICLTHNTHADICNTSWTCTTFVCGPGVYIGVDPTPWSVSRSARNEYNLCLTYSLLISAHATKLPKNHVRLHSFALFGWMCQGLYSLKLVTVFTRNAIFAVESKWWAFHQYFKIILSCQHRFLNKIFNHSYVWYISSLPVLRTLKSTHRFE